MTDPFSVINDPELTVINGAGVDAWGIGPVHSDSTGSRGLDMPPLIEDVHTPGQTVFVAAPEPMPVEPVLPVSDDDPEES